MLDKPGALTQIQRTESMAIKREKAKKKYPALEELTVAIPVFQLQASPSSWSRHSDPRPELEVDRGD